MTMKRCEQGHYYDSTKHTSCPSCGVGSLDLGSTMPRRDNAHPSPSPSPLTGATAPRRNDNKRDDDHAETIRAGQAAGKATSEEGCTVGIFRKKTGIDPVVGWLVCIDGPDRGRDYQIRSEKNFIGRSQSMNICIQNDESVSRENHASVSYNPKNRSFKLHPGDSRGLVYLNDDDVDVPTVLKPYDVIELGQTKLMFIPFCGEQFQWT
ncbi:MAG: FHA domain-containing protein [Desulfamplus sp.]|nr:FHA domain-containing protein [Desulfamplus sp.]